MEELGRHEAVLAGAIETAGKHPKDFKMVPTTKSFGPLAGAYVHRAVWDDIVPLAGGLDVS